MAEDLGWSLPSQGLQDLIVIFAFKCGPSPSSWAEALNLNKEIVASCCDLNRNSANYNSIEVGLPLSVFSHSATP